MNVTLLFSREQYLAAANAYMRGLERRIAAGLDPKVGSVASMFISRWDKSDVLYSEAHAAPDTINTIPEETLCTFVDHGRVTGTMPTDGGDAEEVLGQFTQAGVDVAALGDQLQREGARSFDQSWNKLMRSLASKSGTPTQAGRSTGVSS